MSERRLARVAEEIKRELSQMIREELKDPRIRGLISVTGVEVTNDLRYAKVYLSMLAEEEERQMSMKLLERAGGYLRSELAKRLRIRYTPELIFKYDPSIAYGTKINKILSNIKQEMREEDTDV